MIRKHRGALKLNIVKISMLLLVFALAGCGQQQTTHDEKVVITGFAKPEVGTYDSVDTEAIILSKDMEKQTVTFYNRQLDKNYTLNYDGTSKLYDRYGSALVMDQIKVGDIVDITFTKKTKLINSISKSQDIWIYDNLDEFDIDSLTSTLSMNGGDYRFSDKLKIFSVDGKAAQLIDINSCDRIAVAGKEHNIYTIVIEQTHGYLRLQGQDYFEGGWIEIGNKIIRTVTKDMLFAVPVGKYEVKLSNGEFEGSRTVNIAANMETVLDASDMVVIEEKSEGTIVLVIEPKEAKVHIDGKSVDTSKPITLEYGIHQIIAQADGYKTLTQYIKVAQASATLDITMDKNKNGNGDSGSSPSPEAIVTTYITQAATAFETSDYNVHIESPEEADVYLDGAYVGKIPVSFPKTEGVHVVTLRREGYQTRSYTIRLDGTLQDETFSFSSLVSDTQTVEKQKEENKEEKPEPPAEIEKEEEKPTPAVEEETKEEEKEPEEQAKVEEEKADEPAPLADNIENDTDSETSEGEDV